MSLNGFLLVILVLLPLLLLAYKANKISKSPIPYFIIIVLVLLGSYWTFVRYAKSQGEHGYYKNTDYHVIQQEGFKYTKGQKLLLCSDKSQDSALLATGIGELWLDGNTGLNSRNFSEPIYLEDADHPLNFHVINNIDEFSMANGDSLTILRKNEPLLNIKYLENYEKGKIKDYSFVFSVRGREWDTVQESVFRKGYNLADLLQRGKSTRLDPGLLSLFGDCYLIRDHYQLDNIKSAKTSDNVYLFTNNRLFDDTCSIMKNSLPVDRRECNNVRQVNMDGRYLFFGLPTSKSTLYKVTTDDNDVYVKYRLPIMYHFPGDLPMGETQMYMTTDIHDIIDHRNDFKCFYQFSEQLTDSSIYKASAVLNFIIDSAGKSMAPVYVDLISDKDVEDIKAGKVFEMKTMSETLTPKNPNVDEEIAKVSYLFSIKDMRNNEVYRYTIYLYLGILFLFMVIYLLPHFKENDNRTNKYFILETSVYLVLIAFLTVRLVLLWRLHTFPPIDDVSFKEFHSLTGGRFFYSTFAFVILFLVCRILFLLLWKGKKQGLNGLFDSLFRWIHKGKSVRFKERKLWKEFKVPYRGLLVALLLPIVVYLGVLLFSVYDKFWVAAKESLAPLLAFLINSVFYVACARNKDRAVYCWFAMIWNTACYLFFLGFVYNELGMLFPMMSVFALWFFIAAFTMPNATRWKWSALVGIVAVLLLVVSYLHVPLSQKPLGKKVVSAVMPSRTKARIDALNYTPSEMVQDTTVEYKGVSMQHILNASSNKWFIDNHLIQRKRMVGDGNDFMLDKEYHQNAVKYEVQTRDLLVLRYLVYEHGSGVAKKLLWILALLAINVFVLYKRKDDELPYLQQLPLQTSLFLLLFSVYLYLVNINAVVFVGLDFPFLTLTSNSAPLGLLLPLFALLLPIKLREQEHCLSPQLFQVEKTSKTWVGVAAMVIMVVLVAIPSHQLKKKMRNKTLPASFSVSMEPLAVFVNNYLNPSFTDYQQNPSHKKMTKMKVNDGRLKDSLNVFLHDDVCGLTKNLKSFDATSGYGTVYDNFIKSAFKKLFKTNLIDTGNVLYVRKSNGRFVFVTNRQCYEMKPLFVNDSLKGGWHGDLLAAGSKSQLNFVGMNKTPVPVVMSDHLTKYGKEGVFRQYMNYQSSGGASFELYQIPAKYCYDADGRDVFVMVVNSTMDDSKFQLDPLGDATNRIPESTGLRIFPNDAITVNGGAQFSITTEDNHYFSKRIHYNGKHQVIYPLREKFMFAYNFDQMLADSYTPHDSATEPVRISLDYDLLNQVMEYCGKLAKENPRPMGDGIAVTAVDGKGRIRLLADYNPHKSYTADPNQTSVIRNIMDSIYLNGDAELERGLLQNRNIARMPIGPGSTIKVPFYVALLSSVDIPWENLGIRYTGNKEVYLGHAVANARGKNRDVVLKFGPDNVTGYHKLNGWDEMAGEYSKNVNQVLNPSDFIATSNNFYYGSVLMLGTYHQDDLNQGLNHVLTASTREEKAFPNFVLPQGTYKFKDGFIGDFKVGDRKGALENGLMNGFGFLTAGLTDNLIQHFDRRPVERLLQEKMNEGSSGMNALYVYSTHPSLKRDIFYTNYAEKNDDYNKHFNLTSGGVLQMDVTPLSMAEMYLRVALQNGYIGGTDVIEGLLTYQDDVDSIPFAELSNYRDFPKRMTTTYHGMWKVLNQGGTWHGTLFGQVGTKLKNELKAKGIFLYGKTGTAASSEQKRDNYHYAFILSNKNLHETAYSREGLKIYVVYFGFYNGTMGHKYKAKGESPRDVILRQIINSESFMEYWNEN